MPGGLNLKFNAETPGNPNHIWRCGDAATPKAGIPQVQAPYFYDSPTISPVSGSRSIFMYAGWVARPGMVLILPISG